MIKSKFKRHLFGAALSLALASAWPPAHAGDVTSAVSSTLNAAVAAAKLVQDQLAALDAQLTSTAQAAPEPERTEMSTPNFDIRAISADNGEVGLIARDSLPKTLQEMLTPEEKVVKAFQGVSGVITWIVHSSNNPGQAGVIYTPTDGSAVITGALYTQGVDGMPVNHTQIYGEKYKPVVDYSNVWPRLESATWVRDGATDETAKSTIYGFFDANCIYCHLAALALEPYMKAGLQVRWLPVAVIAPTSDGKAAAILLSSDPSAALQAGHKAWDETNNGTNAFPIAEVPERIRVQLDMNAALMRDLGARGTPMFFYKDSAGVPRAVNGLPPQEEIPTMTGLPAIESVHPKLKQKH